jgi:hypothetical protein
VNTRTVFYKNRNEKADGMALAPFLDLINHSPQPNTSVEFINEPKQRNKETRGYLIKAVKTIQANSQIYISYGSHPNYKLWVDYGFVPFESNLEDFIPVNFNHLCDNFLPFSPLKTDLRKKCLIEKYCLDQELNLLLEDVSPNLVLLVGVCLWNPEKDGHFGFQTDFSVDSRLKEGVVNVVEFKLVEYQECLNSVMSKIVEVDDNLVDTLKVAESYLSKAIKLLCKLKNSIL